MRTTLLFITALLVLVGCETPTKVVDAPPKPIPYIPVENEANVVIPGKTKAYAIERYQDPADPNMLHERSVVYRKETSDQWRTNVSSDRQILIGNTMTDGKLDGQLRQDIMVELERNKAATAQLLQASSQLQLAKDKQTLNQVELMAKQNEQQGQLEELRRQNTALQKRLDSLLKSMGAVPETSTNTTAKAKGGVVPDGKFN